MLHCQYFSPARTKVRRHENTVVTDITLARSGDPGGVIGLRLLSQSVSLVLHAGRHGGRITGAHTYYREPNINMNDKYRQKAERTEFKSKEGIRRDGMGSNNVGDR